MTNLPGAFAGETITRRRLMSTAANATGAIVASAIGLPAIGFAIGPLFNRASVPWQDVGAADEFAADAFSMRVVNLTTDAIGEAAKSTVFIRRRNPEIDTEPADRWNAFVAVSSRCAHVGCPVSYKEAAQSFVCPCHGGVYDIRGARIGGPPPRPLDRFFTRVRNGRLELGARYSLDSHMHRHALRDPGEALDGIGKYLYPPRPSTPAFPK